MKKGILKCFAVILLLCLTVVQTGLISTTICNAATVVTADVAGDASIDGSTTTTRGNNYGSATTINLKGHGATDDQYRIGYMKFDLTGKIPQGQAIGSATLKFYLRNASSWGAATRALKFFATPSNGWEESTLTWNNAPITRAYAQGNTPDATKSITVTNSMPYTLMTADVSSIALSQYSGSSPHVSFVTYIENGGADFRIASKEDTEGDYKAVLEITTIDIPQLSLNSVTPTDNSSEVHPADSVKAVFSNNIDSNSVTTDGIIITNTDDNQVASLQVSDISVVDNEIIISKILEPYTNYTVTLKDGIQDIYSQSLENDYSFSFRTGMNVVELQSTVIADTAIYSDNPDSNYGSSETYSTTQYLSSKYGYIKLSIPTVPTGKPIKNITVSAYITGATTNVSMYKVNNEAWSESTLTYTSHSTDAPIGDSLGTVRSEGSTWRQFDLVIPGDYIQEKITAGESTVSIAFTTGGTRSYASKENSYALWRPTATLYYDNDPMIKIVSTSPINESQGASLSTNIELNFQTDMDATTVNSQYINIINESNGQLVSITNDEITYDSSSKKAVINLLNDLGSYTQYSVVLKSGLKDLYSNTLASDKNVLTFTTGDALEVDGIKITDNLNDSYDVVTELQSFTAGATIRAITKVTNTTSTSKPGVIIIALYDSSNNLIDISLAGGEGSFGANTTSETSTQILVPSDAPVGSTIKGMLWNGIDTIRPLSNAKVISMQ